MEKEITVENMTIENVREFLPSWLHTCALQEHYGFRGMNTDREYNLTQRAYELLEPEEYIRILKKTIKEWCE